MRMRDIDALVDSKLAFDRERSRAVGDESRVPIIVPFTGALREVARLAKTSIGKTCLHGTMRLSTEYRGCEFVCMGGEVR